MIQMLPIVKRALGNLVGRRFASVIVSDTVDELPALHDAKGCGALVALLKETIIKGDSDTRALAGQLAQLLIEYASADALKPHAIHIAGAIIRIFPERYVAFTRVAC